MRKKISLVILAVFLLTTLTGCQEKNNSDISLSSEIVQSKKNTSEVNISESILQITYYGKNKAIISFTDERVSEFLGSDTNYTSWLSLCSDENYLCHLHPDVTSWYSYSEKRDETTDEPEWYYDGKPELQKIEGNTISWEINKLGIGELLQQCDTYEFVFYEKDSMKVEYSTDGYVELKEGECENSEGLEFLVTSNNLLGIRVKNQEAINSHDQSGYIYCINFYNSDSEKENGHISLQLQITEYETVYAETIRYESIDEYSGNIFYEEILDNNGNEEIGRTVNTEYGMAIQCTNSKVVDLIKNSAIYEIADDSNVMDSVIYASGYVTDSFVSIPEIPVVFPVNDKDSEFFIPNTDNYILAMAEYPTITSLDFDYGADVYGNPIYYPCSSHITSYKAFALVSYDEFGIISSKVKLVYENATEAMTAPADRLTWCYLTGSEEGYEALITDFFEQLISPGEYDGWQYMGRYDAVKYFYDDTTKGGTSHEVLSYVLNKQFTFDENGFFTDLLSYSYDFPDFTAGHSYGYDDTATVTVYSSKQDKTNN